MRIFTIASPSHRGLLKDYFIPSVKKVGEYELTVMEIPQYGDSSFGSQGFNRACLDKLYLLERLAKLPDEYVLYADCDIVFLQLTEVDLRFRIGAKDALFQSDAGMLCAGFIFMRPSKRLSDFFRHCILDYRHGMENDQDVINRNRRMMNFGLLPAEYYNIAFANHGKVHNTGDIAVIPAGIRMFHANWTVGIDNKIELLKLALRNNDTDN